MTISTVTAARSTPGRRLQRSEDSRAGQHRVDRPGHVDRRAAPGRLAIERAAGRDEARDVGDVDPQAGGAGALGGDGDGVVVVLGALGVDRDDPLVAQVAAPAVAGRRRPRPGASASSRTARGKGRPESVGRQQRAQGGARRARRAVDGGHAARPAPHRHRDQVAHLGAVARALGQGDARARLEGRLGRRSAPRRHQLRDEHLLASLRRGLTGRPRGPGAGPVAAPRRPACAGCRRPSRPGAGRAWPGRSPSGVR